MKKQIFTLTISAVLTTGLLLNSSSAFAGPGDSFDGGWDSGPGYGPEDDWDDYGPGYGPEDDWDDYGPGYSPEDDYGPGYGPEDDWDDYGPGYGLEDDWDDSYGGSGYGWDDYYSGTQVSESELSTWKTGIGSAKELDGNIVIVSIFANDKKTSWDFSSANCEKLRTDSLHYLQIATDWITEEGESWGKEPVFIYNWEENPDLYYEVSIKQDITSDDYDPTSDMSSFIEENIDSTTLLQKYDAESILFITYFNTPLSNETTSFTIPYDDSCDSDYEICYLLLQCDSEEEGPAAYAHEMLHAFGAPDLYTSENPEYNYNIDGNYVRYCEQYHANEIMMTTYDVDTYETYYDHISNVLTEITAYYIGWTDECQDVEDFQLQESQYILQNDIV